MKISSESINQNKPRDHEADVSERMREQAFADAIENAAKETAKKDND